mgnify:CR=1 FL=1
MSLVPFIGNRKDFLIKKHTAKNGKNYKIYN